MDIVVGSQISKEALLILTERLTNQEIIMKLVRMEQNTKGEQRTRVYYTHPYCYYERGMNENTNKLIRRLMPYKGEK